MAYCNENRSRRKVYGRVLRNQFDFYIVQNEVSMLAQRAAERYDIEILTTCIKDMVSKENSYPEGEETVDGILVRRFPVRQPEDGISEKHYIRRLKLYGEYAGSCTRWEYSNI